MTHLPPQISNSLSSEGPDRLSRRRFLARSAAHAGGAIVSSYGFAWGDLAYGQQLGGKPVTFNAAIRPDWTQGWSGMIIQEKQLWKKYLPPGSEVTFSHPIQGGIVTNELIAGKSVIGYNGDAPGLIGTFQRERADIRAIGLVGSSPSGYQTYQILVRKDAPDFSSSKEAVKWLDGKRVATPKGSASDRFFQFALMKEGVKPKEYLNMSIGVVTTSLRAGEIDGACTWEPQGSAVGTVAGDGWARVVSTGEPWSEPDSGTIVCRKDFMDEHPDVVKAWLKAEIEAQLWYCDPRNHAEVLRIAQKYVTGFKTEGLWFALAGLISAPYYGGAIRDSKPFVWNDDIRGLHKRVLEFLAANKVIPSATLLPGAIDDTLARQAMQELGLRSPLTSIKAVPLEKGYPLVQDASKVDQYAALFA